MACWLFAMICLRVGLKPDLFHYCSTASPRLSMRAQPRAARQTALATVAALLGKRATIFVAQRAQPASANIDGKTARRPDRASFAGLSQCRSGTRTRVLPAHGRASSAVWLRCAGSRTNYCSGGTLYRYTARRSVVCGWLRRLARGLAQAWPNARRHVVQVGRALSPNDVAGATIHEYPKPFKWAIKKLPPFPSDPHYDAKAWEFCLDHKGSGVVLFWNVTGPAQP